MNKIVIDLCTPNSKKRIENGIVEFNKEQVPYTQAELFCYPEFQAEINNSFAGGILGKRYCWNCLYIDVLYVEPEFRGMGIGSLLLLKMHEYAVENGCSLIHLDTFDFQAKEFYLKHKYEVFGELTNCPPGHSRFYMKRELQELSISRET